jgi:hypothetical protein
MKKLLFFTLALVLIITVVAPGCGLLRRSSQPAQTTAPPPPPPPPRPDVKVTAVIPQTSVTFGDIVDMIVVVNNYGQGAASNLRLYGRATPSGYLEILACQPTPTPLAPAGFMFSLGDLYPNGRSDVRMTFRTPQQYQIGNLPGMNIGIRFTYDYFYQGSQQPEMPAGDLTFSLSGSGGVLFFKAY